MMTHPILAFLLSLCFLFTTLHCTTRIKQSKLSKNTPDPNQQRELKKWVINEIWKPHFKTILEDAVLTPEAARLLKIMAISSYFSATDLFLLGKTCKAINFCLRNGFLNLPDHLDDKSLLTLLASRPEIKLYGSMIPFISDSLMHYQRLWLTPSARRIDQVIFNRAGDLAFARSAYNLTASNETGILIQEKINTIKNYLYEVMSYQGKGSHTKSSSKARIGQQVIYIPSENGTKLFDAVDFRIIGSITSITLIRRAGMFAPALLADYVIPGFRRELELTDHMKKNIRAMASANTRDYTEYFEHLFAALHLIYGSVQSGDAHVILIFNYLEELGFPYKRLNEMIPLRKDLANNPFMFEEDQMPSIFRIAQHWKLDIMRLAQNTMRIPKYHTSQEIAKGNLPFFLRKGAPISTKDVMFCMFYKTDEPEYIGKDQGEELRRADWLFGRKINARLAGSSLELPPPTKRARIFTDCELSTAVAMFPIEPQPLLESAQDNASDNLFVPPPFSIPNPGFEDFMNVSQQPSASMSVEVEGGEYTEEYMEEK